MAVKKKYGLFLLLLLPVMELMYGQDLEQYVNDYLEEITSREQLLPQDCKWEILRSHTSKTSGILHIYFIQSLEGIPVSGTESSIHLNGQMEQMVSHNNFIKDVQSLIGGSKRASLSGIDAVNRAINEFAYPVLEPVYILESSKGGKKLVLSNGNYFEEKITPELKWVYTDYKRLELAWDFYLAEQGHEHYWRIKVDAVGGKILSRDDDILYCTFGPEEYQSAQALNYNFDPYPPKSEELGPVNCSNCYELFADPMESPYEGERVIVQDPAYPIASPYGWHDLNGGEINTSGNNADVYTELGRYRASGGANKDFTGFEFDENYSSTSPYRDAALTNVFYWINYLHDITFVHGFDEASGNFQKENFGEEGNGEDQMNVIIQSGSRCNASVIIPPIDGFDPTITLYSCDGKDGAVDNTVLLHEFGHAIIRRLGCGRFHGEEGLADYFAALFTLKPTDDGVNPKGMANYFFSQGIDGPGVRPHPYSTNFNINPSTYGDVANYTEVHDYGSVWGVAMWDFTWNLIDLYGFDPDYENFTGVIGQDAGNIMALAITIEALKLMPCPSGFLDFRNALLNAAKVIYGPDILCQLWAPFANRGRGQSAKQGELFDLTDHEEAFDLPPATATFSQEELEICYMNQVFEDLGGGYPFGGIYSGTGVTDNGDGISFIFNPIEAGPGVHIITYAIEDSACSIASFDTMKIIVPEQDVEGPAFECPGMVSMVVNDFRPPQVPNMISNIRLTDNCGNFGLRLSQEPPSGTEIIDPLNPPVIKIIGEDKSGNLTICEVIIDLTVKEVNRFLTEINLFPIPSQGTVNVQKLQGGSFVSASVYSLSGELVKYYDLQQVESETILVMENLAAGAYLIRFSMLQTDDIIKYILIE